MTEELIKEINDKCPYNQGIFKEPNWIPVHIKGHVVYTRWETGGYSGGSCWDDSDPQPYSMESPEDRYFVLDLVLKQLCPDITYLQYKGIDKLWHSNDETEEEYYGNSTDWRVKYIILSELEHYIKSLTY